VKALVAGGGQVRAKPGAASDRWTPSNTTTQEAWRNCRFITVVKDSSLPGRATQEPQASLLRKHIVPEERSAYNSSDRYFEDAFFGET
jgi:hypothetical protein